ncbi:LysR family transcriptional regulator [Corallococcus sp. CA054B]|uniref:LysR family transcriptional regulator n=1 Tax=Corallococcus sp. CA054B TaxID=2316734 RepID=UPI000EA14B64|nr:LysR family transcriptional regulator [Corallococcus sp. CA054B]RKG65520.1 LysR family transcriptional regulator [Corallococcus sp. CA054B]
MNLDFVEAFYWAAALKNVTRAAEKLFLTQSAVSARIARLEEELNTSLLDRRDKHFRLTTAGARFFTDAERLLGLWRDIKTGMGSGPRGPVSLRIGAIESVLHAWLISWLERLRVEQPGLELQLIIETTAGLHDLMRRGALDLVLAALPVHEDGVRTRELPSMPMGFVGKRGLHTRRRYTLAQLTQGGFLTFQRGSQPYVALLDLLRGAGFEAPRVHTSSSISAMVSLVASGLGVATLPHPAIHRLARAEGLRLLPCDVELVPLPIHLSWRVDPTSHGMDAVVESAAVAAHRNWR